MKSTLTKITSFILASIIGITASFAAPAVIAASSTNDPCSSSLPKSVREANGCPGTSVKKADTVITNVLNAIIGVLGIVAVIFVIVGGVKYMTSAGDPGKIQQAKKTILYALIGLAVCALAFAIVNLVIGAINKA